MCYFMSVIVGNLKKNGPISFIHRDGRHFLESCFCRRFRSQQNDTITCTQKTQYLLDPNNLVPEICLTRDLEMRSANVCF